MSDQPKNLDTMSCDELLRELARLTSERDRTSEQVATPAQAGDEQAPQVATMINESDRVDRIGQLLKEKNCDGSPG